MRVVYGIRAFLFTTARLQDIALFQHLVFLLQLLDSIRHLLNFITLFGHRFLHIIELLFHLIQIFAKITESSLDVHNLSLVLSRVLFEDFPETCHCQSPFLA